jgi:hypothetical protein
MNGSIKSDRSKFIHNLFRQLVNDIKYGNDPFPKLNQALQKLNSKNIPPELLAYPWYYIRILKNMNIAVSKVD